MDASNLTDVEDVDDNIQEAIHSVVFQYSGMVSYISNGRKGNGKHSRLGGKTFQRNSKSQEDLELEMATWLVGKYGCEWRNMCKTRVM